MGSNARSKGSVTRCASGTATSEGRGQQSTVSLSSLRVCRSRCLSPRRRVCRTFVGGSSRSSVSGPLASSAPGRAGSCARDAMDTSASTTSGWRCCRRACGRSGARDALPGTLLLRVLPLRLLSPALGASHQRTRWPSQGDGMVRGVSRDGGAQGPYRVLDGGGAPAPREARQPALVTGRRWLWVRHPGPAQTPRTALAPG